MRKILLAVTLFSAPVLLAQNPTTTAPPKPITVKVAPAAPVSTPNGIEVDSAHAATPAQVREYLGFLHFDTMVNRLLTQFLGAMKASAPPYLPDSFWDDMKSTLTKVDFISGVIPIYQKHISSDDMTGVLAFYRTPAGQHLLENQQVMSAESQAHFQEIGAQLGQEVALRHQDEIIAAKKKYEDNIAAQHSISPN